MRTPKHCYGHNVLPFWAPRLWSLPFLSEWTLPTHCACACDFFDARVHSACATHSAICCSGGFLMERRHCPYESTNKDKRERYAINKITVKHALFPVIYMYNALEILDARCVIVLHVKKKNDNAVNLMKIRLSNCCLNHYYFRCHHGQL